MNNSNSNNKPQPIGNREAIIFIASITGVALGALALVGIATALGF